jgi:hypothetical protein
MCLIVSGKHSAVSPGQRFVGVLPAFGKDSVAMLADVKTNPSSLESEATSALSAIRQALIALVEGIGSRAERATDLQRTLGIDSKLSWQVFNIIHEADPLAAVKLVPGEPSLNRLLKAAELAGASRGVTDAVRAAVAAFTCVVERHAEDRAEFDFMTSSLASSESAAAAESTFRRNAYRAESHIWGLSVDLIVGTTILRRSADGMGTDECSVSSKQGCRRLRPDAPRSVFAYRNYGTSGAPAVQQRVPLDAKAAERYGAHLLPRFCSQPIPLFKTWQRPDGYVAVDVQSEEIGRRSAINLTFGSIFRNCPLATGIGGQPYYHQDGRLYTPAKKLVSYILVHRPSFGVISPSLQVFRISPGDENQAVAQCAPQIPVRERVQMTGQGKKAWQSPDLPEYGQIVQSAFDELGWNPAEFDTYCVSIDYPVLHSVVRIQFPITWMTPPAREGHSVW